MKTLLDLPEYLTTPYWWKLLLLSGFACLVFYLATLAFANSIYKRWTYGRWGSSGDRRGVFGRDRAISFAQLWALVLTFGVVQLYLIAVVNYNLDELTRQALKTTQFYLNLLPELLVSLALIIAFILIRADLKSSIHDWKS